MNTILVPIDFSAVSQKVVSESARLARLFKARLVLIHVVRPPVIATDYGLMLNDLAVYTAAVEKDAKRRLARLQTKLRADGLRAETVGVTGVPDWCILKEAKAWAADYIVIGSHGHTALHDLLVGSTAHGVLKRATCPVVVVPSPRKRPGKAKR